VGDSGSGHIAASFRNAAVVKRSTARCETIGALGVQPVFAHQPMDGLADDVLVIAIRILVQVRATGQEAALLAWRNRTRGLRQLDVEFRDPLHQVNPAFHDGTTSHGELRSIKAHGALKRREDVGVSARQIAVK
jgi:hypothetical protein